MMDCSMPCVGCEMTSCYEAQPPIARARAMARMASAFSAFDRVSAAERGWPAKAQSFNPTLRLTAGLLGYSERAGRQHPTEHETLPNGRLCLSPAMPLLAHRYRYM